MDTIGDHSIPILGFGTYQLTGDKAVHMVNEALNIGYRHIDTAQAYGNEAEVGQAIRNAGVARDAIFLTTKVWIDQFTRDRFAPSVDQSLAKLQTDYVDLLLLHWPNANVPLSETLEELLAVQAAGKARLIGVSNFTTALMREAIAICGAGNIANNQIEYHPYLWQDTVINAARSLGITITAYRPVAKGKLSDDPVLGAIAKTYNKTATQIALRWIVQQGVIAIPRTGQAAHAAENFDIFDFTLSDTEVNAINALRGDNRLVNPDMAPQWDAYQPA